MLKETATISNEIPSVQKPDKPKVPSYKDHEKVRTALEELDGECRAGEERVIHKMQGVEGDSSYSECRVVEPKIEA